MLKEIQSYKGSGQSNSGQRELSHSSQRLLPIRGHKKNKQHWHKRDNRKLENVRQRAFIGLSWLKESGEDREQSRERENKHALYRDAVN